MDRFCDECNEFLTDFLKAGLREKLPIDALLSEAFLKIGEFDLQIEDELIYIQNDYSTLDNANFESMLRNQRENISFEKFYFYLI